MVDVTDITSCSATAGLCQCIEPGGHLERDGSPHRCEEITCQSAWRGHIGTEDFEPIEYPIPLRALMA